VPGTSCELNAGLKKIETIMNLSSGADTHKSESLIPQRSRGHQSPAQSLSVIAQRPRDHAWWVEEAARSGTDSPSVVRAALEMLVAAGIVEQPAKPSPLDAPSGARPSPNITAVGMATDSLVISSPRGCGGCAG
jgi:hypothetical protein